jgi:hypothetical protein
MHAVVKQIDFKESARRHWVDAELLRQAGRTLNAGQLYGFMAECGLKALLVAHGLPIEPNGDIKRRPVTAYRKHPPDLTRQISTLAIFPDGRAATRYLAMLPDLAHFDDWSIDHRYWAATAHPSGSLNNWREAARQVDRMLDAATVDGVM